MVTIDIIFSHANGFPANCYRFFFKELKKIARVEGFLLNIKYINVYGVSGYPIDVNWQSLVDELIDFVKKQCADPVVLIGHSLGGFISLSAAAKQPELFSQVLAIDPPFLQRRDRWVVALFRFLGIAEKKFQLIYKAGKRRNSFPSREVAIEYFRNKALFKDFDQQCLEDYVDYGFISSGGQGQIELLIPREVEANIFLHVPCFFSLALNKIESGAVFYAFNNGNPSRPSVAEWFSRVDRSRAMRAVPYEGGHLYPFENPRCMAKILSSFLFHGKG